MYSSRKEENNTNSYTLPTPQQVQSINQSTLSEEDQLTMELMDGFDDDFVPEERIIDTPNRQFWDKMQQKADYVSNMNNIFEEERQALQQSQDQGDSYAHPYDATASSSQSQQSFTLPAQKSSLNNERMGFTPNVSSITKSLSPVEPVGLTRLRILSDQVSPNDYENIMNLPPLLRMKKIYEVTRGKKVPSLQREHDKRNSEAILPLFRDEEQDEYDQVFDLNSTAARMDRNANVEQRKQQMARQMKEISQNGERKTGYLSTEQEAKDVRKAMVAVQYEKDGEFVPIPESFDPQKDKFHILTLDQRLLFEDSPRARANEMVDLLFRVRAKEGDAQSILDMTDRAERRRLIKLYTKGRTYANTPISLPTSGQAAHVTRHASPEYVNASLQERNNLSKRHYSDSNNVISDSRSPYVYIKSTVGGSATYNVNADARIDHGFDIQSPMGSREKLEEISNDDLQWYAITQAVHGGNLDWSLPEFVDEKGDVIHPHVMPLVYAKAARKYLNSSVQAILHEVYHHRTNSPILFKQEKVKDKNGVERTVDTNMTKVPGGHPSIHASDVTEMLNATHALKRYVRENFPNETLHHIDDFDFLYDILWNPRDNSAEAARIRATIPRDARILFTVYAYMNHQDKVSERIHNVYRQNRDAIMQKHPEIRTVSDIYRGYPKLMEIINNGTKEQKQAIDKNVLIIIRAIYKYSIDNVSNRRELFRKWFSDNAAFEQASLPRREDDNMA